MSPFWLLLLVLVVVTSSKVKENGVDEVKIEWFEAEASDEGDGQEVPEEPEVSQKEAWRVYGRSQFSSDFQPPSGYSYRVFDVDELDCEQGSVKAYVPFESLVYSVPSFTLAKDAEGEGQRRNYAPKQVWLTPPRFDAKMYRLAAWTDFIIWADEEGRVTELYRKSPEELIRRPHYNKSSEQETRMLSLLATASPRYRLVGVDSEGRFLALCLRAKVSIDCTAFGAKGVDNGSYFWLDLGSALPSYRFKGVAVVSMDAKRFFLLTRNGHLVCMETDNRMAIWRTWVPPSDVSLEIVADAQVAVPNGILVISADGRLFELDLDDIMGASANGSAGSWKCHNYPELTGPLALMEGISLKDENDLQKGSLFLLSRSGELVEWKSYNSGERGVWIVHHQAGTPLASAPIAFVNGQVFHIFLINRLGGLEELQYFLNVESPKDVGKTRWLRHGHKSPLALKRGAVCQSPPSLWFFQSNGNLVERRILSPDDATENGMENRDKKKRWEIFIYDKDGNNLKSRQ